MTCPKPGLYRDVPFDEYASWDALNASTLNLFSETASKARVKILKGGESSPAKDLGWLTHLAILEPARFEAEVVTIPKIDKRTNIGKAAWAAFQAENADKYHALPEDYAAAVAMRDSVLRHEAAAEALSGPGVNELSLVWEEGEARCKARIDRIGSIGSVGVVIDIKTAKSAKPWAFGQAAFSYGYHVQAAHYLAGLRRLVPPPAGNPERTFIFLCIENFDPWDVCLFDCSDGDIELGEDTRQKYIRTYQECLATGVWPGYGNGIESLRLPAYAFKREE